MKTATVVLKLNQLGSSVTLKGVTPPQLMYLVAEHQANSGGNPIVKYEIEKKLVEQEVPELGPAGNPLIDNITGKPVTKIGFVPGDEDNELNLSPAQERNRLASIYNRKKVLAFFTGAIPAMPQTFEEAIDTGMSNPLAVDRFITTVGDTGA